MIKSLPLAKNLDLQVGVIHIVGIGGIGMSGIAELLHNMGFSVQGSDMSDNANTKRLAKLGIKVFKGHAPENIDGVSVVVISSAVKGDNVEVQAARKVFIPVVRRAEMLAEIMRLKTSIAIAGTHGKTTTTTMVTTLLAEAGKNPTFINGGIINAYGTNAHLGQGDLMVVEADESDGTFTKLPAGVAVVTNIDPEHLDFYGDFESLRAAFHQFVSNIPFYGFAVMCTDHEEVQQLVGRVSDRRIITYGTNKQADVRAVNIAQTSLGSKYDVEVSLKGREVTLMGIELPMPGHHNLLNSLAAIAIAQELNISGEVIQKAFAGFAGVKRRFTNLGQVRGFDIIDDYAHHPTEIKATLQAARSVTRGRVVVVSQPHRFSRVQDLWDEFCTCFNDADKVVVTPIYPAGEAPVEGVTTQALVQAIQANGHKDAVEASDMMHIDKLLADYCRPDDMVVFMGAGDISLKANEIADKGLQC